MKKILSLIAAVLIMSCNPSGNKAIIPLKDTHSTSHENHKKEIKVEIKDSISQ